MRDLRCTDQTEGDGGAQVGGIFGGVCIYGGVGGNWSGMIWLGRGLNWDEIFFLGTLFRSKLEAMDGVCFEESLSFENFVPTQH